MNLKPGVNAILLTDIISPLVDNDGFPLITAQAGEKVFIVSSDPLMVQKVENSSVFMVREDWIQTTKGRPRSV
jgi:hypothetical protein